MKTDALLTFPRAREATARVRPNSILPAGTCGLLLAEVLSLFLWSGTARAEDYIYVTNNGAITIAGYTGPGGVVAIPGELSGLAVTEIDRFAFRDLGTLTGVTIPGSVVRIGELAFFGCTNLAAVTISEGVATIEGDAFGSCTSLIRVALPSSVTNLGNWVFEACVSLESITVEPRNAFYASRDGVLFDKTRTTLIQCPGALAGSYSVPGTVTNIASYAFESATSLTEITVGDSVRGLGDGAFYNCVSLTNVVLGNGVTNVGYQVFLGCTSLPRVVLPASATGIGEEAFYGCLDLIDVAILDGLSFIGDYAFWQCESLPRMVIPASVAAVGDQAFGSCPELVSVLFSGNCPTAGSEVFDGAPKATVYYLPGATGWGTTFGGAPTMLWNPQVQTNNDSFGIGTNGFGFMIGGTTNLVVVVDAAGGLAGAAWMAVSTNLLVEGAAYFSDPQWTNFSGRFYRLRPP